MLNVLSKPQKPIIMPKGSQHNFSYKYEHTMYALGVPIPILTDLTQEQLDKLSDGYYNAQQVEHFELTGKF